MYAVKSRDPVRITCKYFGDPVGFGAALKNRLEMLGDSFVRSMVEEVGKNRNPMAYVLEGLTGFREGEKIARTFLRYLTPEDLSLHAEKDDPLFYAIKNGWTKLAHEMLEKEPSLGASRRALNALAYFMPYEQNLFLKMWKAFDEKPWDIINNVPELKKLAEKESFRYQARGFKLKPDFKVKTPGSLSFA